MSLPGLPDFWPHREHSRVVEATHRWHVQEMGEGPQVLLIHGSGGATHSWRDVMPALAREARVMAVDLPGQGFTRPGHRRFGLDDMAADLDALIAAQGWAPDVLVGHSAGAAVALRMAGLGRATPRRVVGFNAALGAFEGPAGVLFPVIAKALVANPLTGFLASRVASGRMTRRMLASMGSEIDDLGAACYAHLFGSAGHVRATLAMMAAWNLRPLQEALPGATTPTLLVVGTGDKAVPPSVGAAAVARMPAARLHRMAGGHLAHEEAPLEAARLILEG